MAFWRRFPYIFLTIYFLLAPVSSSFAETGPAFIDKVKLEINAQKELTLDFQLEKAMDARLLDILDSGLPVKFEFWIKVQHPREFFRDKTIFDKTLVRTLRKDNLKNRYMVAIEESGSTIDCATIEEAINLMSRVDDVKLFPVKTLKDDPPLFLHIKAQLNKFKLPFKLHYLLAFVSYWDVETDWYTLKLPVNADALK